MFMTGMSKELSLQKSSQCLLQAFVPNSFEEKHYISKLYKEMSLIFRNSTVEFTRSTRDVISTDKIFDDELLDSYLFLHDVYNGEQNKTIYVLKWLIIEYSLIPCGTSYACHYIRIGEKLHRLRFLQQDACTRDDNHNREFKIFLGLSPFPSEAKIHFSILGKGNKEIPPKDIKTIGKRSSRALCFEFSEKDLPPQPADLVVFLKITVEKISIAIEDHSKLPDLESLYKERTFTDATIVVGEKQFHVHRVVLAAASPVLSRMFQSEMKEKADRSLKIEDSSAHAVGELVKYLYTGKANILTVDLAIDLLYLADKYDISSLKKEVVIYLGCNVSLKTVLDILSVADRFCLRNLKSTALDFATENLSSILKLPNWKEFRSNVELVDCILKCISKMKHG
ncbi:speckle-type POZ protein [Caerostris extrusa]|uniref:Speckle-type POZ protein n=1 Tax=Caerostris extrusa TaxID=172846 RepID=A0AAV4S408_CAEEX|nr:speckle-type POZ protein [Caerostris extrusa]